MVIDRLLELRDDPPEGLGRTPGPKALLYYLNRDETFSVPADPHGKKQHVVETLNIINKGTSVLVAHHVRSDFSAETALAAVAQTFAEHGLPSSITLDRDIRWVGAPQGSDFPAALVRFCHALGVAVVLCDPHHPQQNGFVERYHRTLNQVCLKRERPTAACSKIELSFISSFH